MAGLRQARIGHQQHALAAKQKELLKEFEKAGSKTSPEAEGFFTKVKEMFGGDD